MQASCALPDAAPGWIAAGRRFIRMRIHPNADSSACGLIQAKQVGGAEGEAGKNRFAGNLVGAGVDVGVARGPVSGDRLALRIGHQHQARPSSQVLADFFLHRASSVSRRKDLNRKIRGSLEECLAASRRQSGCGNEGDVRRADEVGIAGKDDSPLASDQTQFSFSNKKLYPGTESNHERAMRQTGWGHF